MEQVSETQDQQDQNRGDQPTNQPDYNPDHRADHKSHHQSTKKRNFWGATAASWRLSRINLSKVKIPKISFRRPASAKPRNWLLLWLLVIMGSYVCMGYFLSVLLTIPNRQILAIAGFTIVGILPIITAFADYGLMKWGYLLSGLLVVGACIFLLRMRFYLTVLSVIIWIGITMIAFVGEYLLKQKRKFVVAIAMITVPCLVGLGIGWQLWNLAANHLS